MTNVVILGDLPNGTKKSSMPIKKDLKKARSLNQNKEKPSDEISSKGEKSGKSISL